MNHVGLAKFALISNDSLFPFRVHKFALISHFWTFVRQDPTPCLGELCKSRTLKLQFAKYPLLHKVQVHCTH